MKTKIRTIIAIFALGTIGLINIHAISDYKKTTSDEFATESEQTLNVESWMTDANIWAPKVVVDKIDNEKTLQIESWMTNESLWK